MQFDSALRGKTLKSIINNFNNYIMKITLISPETHENLLKTYNDFPALFLQNNGYEYIGRNNLKDEEKAKLRHIEDILKSHITGFSKFHNFRLSKKTKEIELRFDYNYNYDNSNIPFYGVGYILLDELLNGFRDN